MTGEKILLGMSGGKDSTWACRVLQKQGFEVEGIVLSLHGTAPVEKARLAAERLGIRLHVADYSEEFKKRVVDKFAEEYANGRTPNPCVECNKQIKFSALLREADRLGISKIATGHYVRVEKNEDGRFELYEGKDSSKDQSYFLWRLGQDALSRFVAPLCDVTKEEVVGGVTESELIDEIEESQEICFVPDDYVDFLKHHLSRDMREKAFSEGNFVSKDRKILGRHKGYASYTVGQRKGLGIALGRPAFVLELRPEENEVVLGFEEDNRSRSLEAESLNFVSIEEFEGEFDCFVRPRYRSPRIPVRVTVKNGIAVAESASTFKLASPGQSAVFYDREGRVLFGGYVAARESN